MFLNCQRLTFFVECSHSVGNIKTKKGLRSANTTNVNAIKLKSISLYMLFN
jgi:hypothetical protein